MRCVVVCLGLGGALVIGELALRLIGFTRPILVEPDPVLGLTLVPGMRVWQSREGGAWSVINSDGWRDRERSMTKPAGAYRIAIVGDSVVQAAQVSFEQSVCAELEAWLHRANAPRGLRAEVLCFGVAGFGTAQELLTFRHHVVKYRPDFVVLMFYPGNDVSDNWKPLNHPEKLAPYFTINGSRLELDDSFRQTKAYRDRTSFSGRTYYWLIRHLRVAQLFHFVRTRGFNRGLSLGLFGGTGDPPEIYRSPPTRDWSEAWRVTEALIRQMHHDVADTGAGFGVAIASTPSQVFADRGRREAAIREHGIVDLFYPDRRIQTLGAEDGFPVVSTAEPLQAVADERGVFLHGFDGTPTGIGHWNAEGHRLAAELIGKWLADVWRTGTTRRARATQ